MKKNFKLIIGGLIIFIVGYFIGDATAINRIKNKLDKEQKSRFLVQKRK
ncbi:hypothetical protein CFSAN002367_19907 [Clostridium botulinum CFSAN002367]|nr:hypothetical protein CFSAN002367_19907 [Clostridium botulinum CFSAN002367]